MHELLRSKQSRTLHSLRTFDAEPTERQYKFPQRDRGSRQQKGPPRRILFTENVMLVVKVIEFLR